MADGSLWGGLQQTPENSQGGLWDGLAFPPSNAPLSNDLALLYARQRLAAELRTREEFYRTNKAVNKTSSGEIDFQSGNYAPTPGTSVGYDVQELRPWRPVR